MIYTITLNPSLDYIMKIDEFINGATNRSHAEQIYPGGKGFNVSRILNEFAQPNKAIGLVAGFVGQEIEKLLNEKGVNHQLLFMKDGFSRINIKLKGKQESEINGAGPIADQHVIDQLKQLCQTFTERDTVAVCGSLCRGIDHECFLELLSILKAIGAQMIIDMSNEALLASLVYEPWLIKPNLDELNGIIKHPITNTRELYDAMLTCQRLGANNVLVSLGKRGAVLLDEKQRLFSCEAPLGEVKNTVGAGDSMIAGFMTAYKQSESYKKALRMGVACGSATSFNDDLAKLKQIMIYYEGLNIQRLNDDELNLIEIVQKFE